MATKSFGLKSFKIGDVATSIATMPTTLTEVGTTVKGTFKITGTDAQTKDFFIEEKPIAPFDSLVTEYPTLELEGESFDVSASQFAKLMDGTSATGVYTPGDGNPLYVCAEIESMNGVKFKIPKLQLIAKPDFAFTTEELGKLSYKGKVLLPDKGAPWAYTEA